MNLLLCLVATLLVAKVSANSIPGERAPLGCNPSLHCHPKSLECVNCHPYDSQCTLNDNVKGVCTDAVQTNCVLQDDGTFACREREHTNLGAHLRCMVILDTKKTQRNGRWWEFVKACRVGWYTCWDGTCFRDRNDCIGSGHGGLKYENFRCSQDCTPLNLGTCDHGSASSGSWLIPKHDACSEECGASWEDFADGPCCVHEYFSSAFTDNSTISEDCVAKREECIDTLGCDACDFSNETNPDPCGAGFPREAECRSKCMDIPSPDACDTSTRSIDCIEKREECIDTLGCDVCDFSKDTDPCGSGFPSDKEAECKEKCYDIPTFSECEACRYINVDDSQIQSPDADGNEIKALQISLEFDEKEESCCCNLLCSCFGDPHCTNFWGDHQSTKAESGVYNYYASGGFSVKGFLGAPKGINEALEIMVSGDSRKFYLTNDQCHNLTHQWQDENGVFYDPADLPPSWTVAITSETPTSAAWRQPSYYTVTDNEQKVKLEINCIYFLFANDPNVRTRMDINLRRDLVRETSGCCPDRTATEELLAGVGASGFCADRTYRLPGVSVVVANNGRRALSSDTTDEEMFQSLGVSQLEVAQERRMLLTDTQILEACQQYLDAIAAAGLTAAAALSDLDRCKQNVEDFGLGALTTVTNAINGTEADCISDSEDPRITQDLSACEQGVELQVRHKDGSTEWTTIRAFSSRHRYCNNQINLIFSRTTVFDNEQLNVEDFEFRLKQCIPDTTICSSCDEQHGIKRVALKMLYESEYADIILQNLENYLRNAIAAGTIHCGLGFSAAQLAADPFACIRAEVAFRPTPEPTTLPPSPTPPPTLTQKQICARLNRRQCRLNRDCWWRNRPGTRNDKCLPK